MYFFINIPNLNYNSNKCFETFYSLISAGFTFFLCQLKAKKRVTQNVERERERAFLCSKARKTNIHF